MKRKFVLQIVMSVDDSWIADGFSCNGKHLKNVKEYIQGLLPYAYGHEFNVKVKLISGPDKSILKKLGSI
jgi:hypothetical protein